MLSTAKCPKCGTKLELEDDVELSKEYKYVCNECDENFYEFEAVMDNKE